MRFSYGLCCELVFKLWKNTAVLFESAELQKKCGKESSTEVHPCVFTIFCSLSLQYGSWGMPPWQTKWKNIWSIFTASWTNVWCKQAMWTYVWSWITSVSLFSKENYVLLFENYHKVVVKIYFKMYFILLDR